MADDFAQLVKRQADIVKIVEEYVRLRKSGAQNYSGLCPFHKEKSPSFSVNAVHGYFYCFGCHEKGDVFTFVMKLENVGFPEALRIVAQKAGIPLPKRDFSSPDEAREAGLRRQLLDVHEAATQYFQAALNSPMAARAREYMSGRGITPETVQRFRIGFAPDDFNHMRDELRKHFSEEVLRASGLFTSKEQDQQGLPTGNLYARFRNRVTFPICNEQGKVIAFTARALLPDEKTPKYLNSPETALYTKGQVLFNLDKAKAAIRAQDYALLVEGQMDCISVFMAGIQPVLATSGTAFTEAQVRLLSRFTKRVVVNFDPDTAGATAAEKSIALLTEEDFEVKVVTLEGGLDPDRFVREQGIQAYGAALRGARRHSDYLIERARTQFPPRTPEAKVKAVNYLMPHIRRVPSAIQRDAFITDAAQKLGIDSSILRQEMKQAAANRLGSIRQNTVAPVSETERLLLRALVQPEGSSPRQMASQQLAAHPEWYDGLTTAALMEQLANAPVPANPLEAAPEPQLAAVLATVLAESHAGDDQLPTQLNGALHTLHRRSMERRQREIRVTIAEADRRGDTSMVGKLTEELMVISRQLREL
ncbi:DNA primase [Terriglobus albidus]|uniref:DNA primase n=1 Tax=Terriglobus albidus TaxID=1592106 RepID=A0A5B9E7T8_9BACT|nr:DNA primase [Terriglobus albidus]QEE26531.1 DNA primase [Terriglobus albidus]